MPETEPFNPRVAIDQFFQHQITGAELMRGMAAHRGWIVPVILNTANGVDPTFMKLRSGPDLHFFMFTDSQAYLECRTRLGIEAMGTHTIDNLFGYNIWESVDDDVDFVNINPFSPNEIHYTKDQIPTLREWGRILRVEEAIAKVLSTDSGYDVIKSFPSYYVGMIHEDGATYIALAPDDKDRHLAAVFTCDDAAEAYVAQNSHEQIQLRIFDGASLFESLQGTTLDGIVFNCCGPVPSRAFALPFAMEVVQRG